MVLIWNFKSNLQGAACFGSITRTGTAGANNHMTTNERTVTFKKKYKNGKNIKKN